VTDAKPTSNTRKLLLAALVVGLVAAVIGYVNSRRDRWPDGLVLANGRIEGDRYVAAAKLPGRISAVLVHEGDHVAQGAIVALITDARVMAQLRQAQAALAAVDAQLVSGQTALDVSGHQANLAIAAGEQAVANARAVVGKADAGAVLADRDVGRMRTLETQGSIETHRREEAELLSAVRAADQKSAVAGVAVAQDQLAEVRLGPARVKAQRQALSALAAQRQQAVAAVAEAQSVADELTIKSPVAGTVVSRIVEPGTVLSAGSAIVELVDLDHLYMTAFVPSVEIGRLRRGLAARVYVDAFPDHPFEAVLRTIANRAEFSPKEVQTKDERVKQVYRIKLLIVGNPGHRLTPGIPADAVIRVDPNTPWRTPKW
jgi:HlyD family secretion protein